MKFSPLFLSLPLILGLQIEALAQQSVPADPAQIQSTDLQTALQAVTKAQTQQDVPTLIVGLQQPSLEVRKGCANALQTLGNTQAVPALISSWTFNRNRVLGPNSKIKQDEVDQALMSALVHLTGQSVDVTKPLNFEQMQAVVQTSKDWATQHGLPSS